MTISSIDAAPPDHAPARATDAAAISAVSVSKRYGSVTALDIRGHGARLTPRIASLTVATIGTYWLVERIFVG